MLKPGEVMQTVRAAFDPFVFGDEVRFTAACWLIQTATAVGQRHGKPVVLTIAASAMHRHGCKFYQADNGVWLTKNVPAHFLNDGASGFLAG